jgi:hypothetical protein
MQVMVYYLTNLNRDSDRVIYFMLDLFAALMAVRQPRTPRASAHCAETLHWHNIFASHYSAP